MQIITQLVAELNGEMGRWEVVVVGWAYSLAQSVAEGLLEKVDQELMKGRRF